MMYDTALRFWKKAPETKFEKVDKKKSQCYEDTLRYTKRQRLRQARDTHIFY